MILSFSDTMPNRSYPPAGFLGVHFRRAFCLEANLNVKREMSESFGKPLTAFETFNARFEELLKELFPTETRKVDRSDLSVPNFLVLRYRRRLGAYLGCLPFSGHEGKTEKLSAKSRR